MIEIASSRWETVPQSQYYGTIKDWTQTLMVKINQSGAQLFQHRCQITDDFPIVYKKIILPEWFRRQFQLLEYYNPHTFNLAGRFDVLTSVEEEHLKVCEEYGDHKFCVTIRLIK